MRAPTHRRCIVTKPYPILFRFLSHRINPTRPSTSSNPYESTADASSRLLGALPDRNPPAVRAALALLAQRRGAIENGPAVAALLVALGDACAGCEREMLDARAVGATGEVDFAHGRCVLLSDSVEGEPEQMCCNVRGDELYGIR